MNTNWYCWYFLYIQEKISKFTRSKTYLPAFSLLGSLGFLSDFKKLSNADGRGKSAIDVIWESSAGDLVSVKFLLWARTASSSSTFTPVRSLVSLQDLGSVNVILPERLPKLSLLVLHESVDTKMDFTASKNTSTSILYFIKFIKLVSLLITQNKSIKCNF